MNASNVEKRNPKRLKKTTRQQYEDLIDFIDSHKILLSGNSKPKEANKIKLLWQEFARKENASANGQPKSAEQWRNIWNEWKYHTKKKSRLINLHMTGTASGKKLTDLEERLLNLISKTHSSGDVSIPDNLVGEIISQKCDFNNVDESGNSSISTNIVLKDFSRDQNFHDYLLKEEQETSYIENKLIWCPYFSNCAYGTTARLNLNLELTPESVIVEPVISADADTAIPIKSRPAPATPNRCNSRYTSQILLSAFNAIADSQRTEMETETLKVEGTRNLAQAIEKLAKVEMLKFKLEYVKHFGNEEGFEEFCKL